MIEDIDELVDLAVSNPAELAELGDPDDPNDEFDLLTPFKGEEFATFKGLLGLKVELGTKSGGG